MVDKKQVCIGLGDADFTFAVYIQNQPNMPQWQALSRVTPLQSTDVDSIGKVCGNGWRKVFNVYAKLLYALNPEHFKFSLSAPTWQSYRDQYLLQEGSQTALLFNASSLVIDNDYDGKRRSQTVHIICGRTYAKQLIKTEQLKDPLLWLDEEFAINVSQRVIVCPYFDYRQLSNIKIQRLSTLLSGLSKGNI
ncbi:DUF6942 family protein [Psychromonas sp. 14N.309.X.WAT.B.A12]|uniref:DUF6942 family protein n=1 Tax=unclassified Psychromonas TaxID=2614957 RepID=UPI0025B10968|nr:hypothetical protein [Psychromonas sp. 14N.309.X.WAT.B.A12]MDN2663924.1 hypothetical protein [Psychromonas sp. 14N.309.X.WAT.B.A12]